MLFRNTLAQSGSLFAGYLFSFLLAPLMLSRLGLDKFGVWAVTGSFATYAGLLDLGIGRSLSRFIAIFDAEGKPEKVRQCVGLGIGAVTVVGLVAIVIVGTAIAPILHDQLGVLTTGQMRLVLISSVAIWSFNGYQSVLNGVGIGRRRMIPPNIATTIGLGVNFIFSVVALLSSTSLVVYALANAAAGVVAIFPAFFAMRFVWDRPYAARPPRALVREVLSFSVKNQVGWIADLVNFQTDKVVIALVVDVRAAAVYEIASRIVIAVRAAAVLTVSAMIPTAAARIVTEGRHVVGEMYRRYTLRTAAIAFPMFMLAAVSGGFLLVAWLGEAPGDSAVMVPVLTIAYLANVLTGVGSTIAIGAGNPGMVSLNSSLIAILNVALTVALAPIFGVWGVVGGTFLALLVGGVRFTQRFLKIFDVPLHDFVAGVLPPALVAVPLALPFAVLAILVGIPSDRLTAALLLFGVVLAYGLPYWIVASRRGYLPEKLRLRSPRRSKPAETVV